MIEINARLSRGAVYFAEETIKCVITLTNVNQLPIHNNSNHNTINGVQSGSSNAKTAQATDGEVETLCWAGVQIHCFCTVDESRVLVDSDSQSVSSAAITSTDTSFNPSLMKGEKGRVLYSSSPKILFCDLSLKPNESKSFAYFETIPDWVPPSYSGLKVKYHYKLSIGTQRVHSAIQLLKIPIRVLRIDSRPKSIDTNHRNSISNHGSNEEVDECFEEPLQRRKDSVVSNESTTYSTNDGNDTTANTVLDLSLHKLDCLTAKRCPQSYVITNPLGKVAKFCVLKSTFKLGEDIVGIFNFAESTVPCVQFSVTLQSEEVVREEYRVKDVKASAFTQITSYGKYNDYCLHMNHSQLILSIPLTVTPTFTSDMVSLSWRLHFEFVTTKPEDVMNTVRSDSQGVMEQTPVLVNLQTMVWDLPILMYATHPVQVARGFQIPAASTLTV